MEIIRPDPRYADLRIRNVPTHVLGAGYVPPQKDSEQKGAALRFGRLVRRRATRTRPHHRKEQMGVYGADRMVRRRQTRASRTSRTTRGGVSPDDQARLSLFIYTVKNQNSPANQVGLFWSKQHPLPHHCRICQKAP